MALDIPNAVAQLCSTVRGSLARHSLPDAYGSRRKVYRIYGVDMPNNVTGQAIRAALESEIVVIEEARDALPDDSHLRTLCNLAVERLADLASSRYAVAGAKPASTQTGNAACNKKGQLAGTIRRIAVDPLHPTGWMFATKVSEMPLDAMLDPSKVMNAAEQLEGKQVLLTGYFSGEVNVPLVADSIELQ